MTFLKTIVRRALELMGLSRKAEFGVITASTNPALDSLAPRQIVLVGEGKFRKWAYFRCPCGCGDPIMLSLSRTRRPSWRVYVDWLDRPTLEPSVRQTAGCYSHFWLRAGRVDWCRDTGAPSSAAWD
jgi:hypothetical protein